MRKSGSRANVRTLAIVLILQCWSSRGATVKKNGNTAAVATYHIEGGGDPTNSCLITNANAGFTTADALTIEVTGANATRVTLFTRYPDAYADVLTVVVA